MWLKLPKMAAAWWVIAANDDGHNRDSLRIMRRILRDSRDPFDIPERQFQELYRLSREAVTALCRCLQPHMPQGTRSSAIPSELKILATLSFTASGSYQRRIGQDFLSCMCQSSISGAIHTVVVALNNIMNNSIKFPTENEEMSFIKQQYWENCRFSGVIGAVDGTHIAIWPPEKVREHLYINRKRYHSLNVLLITDYYGKILAVNAGHGGRTHDSRVWNASRVSIHLEEERRNGRTGAWLLGDSGYPLLPYLMTPKLHEPEGTPAARYTDAHVKARSSIERGIGTIKGRFRCLRKERALHYSPEFAGLIVNACCVLHNVAKHYNVPQPDVYLDDIDRAEDVAFDDVAAAGNHVRERLILWHFT